MKRLLAITAGVAVLLTLAPASSADDDTATRASVEGKLVLLLDSSGSMKESTGGRTKIVAAKAALKDVVDELASSLVSVSVRALREFRLTGTPVTGGTSTSDPLPLEPGRYTDTTEGPDTHRYYLIDKPADADVTLSAVSRPPYDSATTNSQEVELLTRDGQSCERDNAHRSNVVGKESILSTGIIASPRSDPPREACNAATTLVARVSLDAPTDEPFELLIGTRPPITNVGSLPGPLSLDEQLSAQGEPFDVTGTVTPVVGGVSFTDAPTLGTGRFTDSVRPGEQLIYKIPVGWGQRARVRATFEADAQAAQELTLPGIVAEVTLVTPTLRSLGRSGKNGGGLWSGSRPETYTAEATEVRANNVAASRGDIRSSSIAGDHYAIVSMGYTLGRDGNNFAAPVTIAVDVAGSESGVHTYAEVEDPDAATGSAAGGGVPWLPIGIGVGVVALLAAGLALRRGSRTPT